MGRPEPPRDQAPGVLRHYVAPNHFRTLRIPVLRGRVFDERDRAGSPRVAVINQTAAERFFPNEDPIGKRVWFGGGSSFDRPDSSAEIVGIVGNVAYQPLDERPFQPDFYTPYMQFTYATRTVLVRTNVDPAAMVPDIRRALESVDRSLAMFDVRTMDEVMSASWARLTYQTKILSGFAVVALLLAATGIFAIVAHVVSTKRREIGVRMALGATHAQVLATVGESGARPAILGLVGGIVAALILERAMSSAVYGVRSFDGPVLGSVAVALATVIGASAYLAARRALRVDPAESLRFE
jgi:putative ABC transport system permease protein